MWGEEKKGKVPVLTATLMASIWWFLGKAPLDPSTQLLSTAVNIITSAYSYNQFLTACV